jgi:hypothetical protein
MLHVAPKHWLTFNGLPGALSLKTEPFINIAVGALSPKSDCRFKFNCILFKTRRFGWNLLSWDQEIELLTVAGHQQRLKTGTESSLRNVIFKIKDRKMNNVQNCEIY